MSACYREVVWMSLGRSWDVVGILSGRSWDVDVCLVFA